MSKKIIIFGNGEIAQLAHFYFSHDSNEEVAGFTVDRDFLTQTTFLGLPNVAFDEIEDHFPSTEFTLFIALSYNNVNELRKQKFFEAKDMGYELAKYVSSKSSIFSNQIGENCFILEDNTIQPFVTIGSNVTLWSGNHVGHHSHIADHCFISSHVVISGGCHIGECSFIGVNSTLRDHVKIGKSNVIGAGSLVLADTNDRNVLIEKTTEVSRVPSNRLRKI